MIVPHAGSWVFAFRAANPARNGRRCIRRSRRPTATGKLDLRTEVDALQIQHDKNGKATGVLYADKDGKQMVQKARVVCVACNSIESARLLLNSADSTFPHGLANSSGQVGKNYMRHTTGSVYGIFKHPVHMYRGTVMAGIITDEAELNTKRGFAGGFEMETISLGLPFAAAFLNPGAWGREYARTLDQFTNMAGMWIVGEDMPQETNAVTLHPSEKDQFGLPIPNVHYDDHPNDLAMREYAFKRGAAVYDAVGAIQTDRGAALSVDAQPGHLPHERKARRWCLQQMGSDPRLQEPIHFRRQPIHDQRR